MASSGKLRGRAWLLAACLSLVPFAATQGAEEEAREEAPQETATPQSSKALERQLQSLEWEQFRSVVTAVPKLRAQVDAYGPLGWQYVRDYYRSYGWRRSIDKLDAGQKLELGQLIARARGETAAPGSRPQE